MSSRKIIWSIVTCLAIIVLVLIKEIDVPCIQCGRICIHEPVLARIACDFQDNFLHYECLEQYCIDNPIRFDAEGNIIRKE